MSFETTLIGCEIIKCPDYKDGKCANESDTVNRETGEAMCPRNLNAIPQSEWEAGQVQKNPKSELPAPPELQRVYRLTIAVTMMGCSDDVEAREIAVKHLVTHEYGKQRIFNGLKVFLEEGDSVEHKLQEIYMDKPPRRVNWLARPGEQIKGGDS